MQANCKMVVEASLKIIKGAGYKLTSARTEILNVLLARTPVNPQEVFEILKRKSIGVDLVTVYRTLELFSDLGLVSKTKFEDGISRYELISEDKHHHHLVCIKCGKVEDIAISEETLVKQIEQQSCFKIQRHALEFFGFCAKCQS